MSGLTTALDLDAGRYHSCARLSGNTAVCWGYNVYGSLGDGTKANKSTPSPVAP
ncbi:MAG: hypothetical protein IPJ34_10610 [Myxococcales bacterium]|nr:hypothetical protein [Myxococcales bacterium]